MKTFRTTFKIVLFLFVSSSCQNERRDVYDVNNYREVSRGMWNDYNTITYQYRYDTNYHIRKLYSKSDYNDTASIVIEYFMFKEIMSGPTKIYAFGKISMTGFMKDNKRHGEFLSYNKDGSLIERSFYNQSKKIGTWEHYSTKGKLSNKVYYDDNGHFQKKEIYDMNGHLVRTELKETQTY
jgi:antitoxin component YwqK of YwqJK toxin-antitoxin module